MQHTHQSPPCGGSVSKLLIGVQQQNEAAVSKLWDRFKARLTRFARTRLRPAQSVMADEDDIATMTFHSFVRRTSSGKYRDVDDRNQLWQLLAMIAKHKVLNHIRSETAAKRNPACNGQAKTESCEFHDCATVEAGPQELAIAGELLDKLLQEMPDAGMRKIVLLRLEGRSNEEIAKHANCSLATVTRRTRLIRRQWLRICGS